MASYIRHRLILSHCLLQLLLRESLESLQFSLVLVVLSHIKCLSIESIHCLGILCKRYIRVCDVLSVVKHLGAWEGKLLVRAKLDLNGLGGKFKLIS